VSISRKDVEISERASLDASIWLQSFSSTDPMRKVADHLPGRLTFDSTYSRATNYFKNLRTPWNRIFGSVRDGTPASQFNRTARTKTTFINWIERCSDARKYKYITKFRVDRNMTHSLVASLLLSCENRSATSSR
jgi:hypothetical protein